MGQQVTLDIGAVGRIEGDLDVRVVVEDGVVVDAWTEAAMFRGFELILKGKDPQAGLIVTPRICGICGGSHLYKSVYALDTAWKTHVPPNATLIRNIAQASETLQSIPRWFYALFAIDLVNKAYAKSKFFDEAVKRFSPFVGTSYEPAVQTSAKPVEIYALFGGQWPHSSFMIPGGVMCAPGLSEITRAHSLLEYWRTNWLEPTWLGCSVERWLENKSWDDVLAWLEESPNHKNSDCGIFIQFCMDTGLDKIGAWDANYISTGTYFNEEKYQHPTIDGRNGALIARSGIYDGKGFHDFDQSRVREDHTHSFYKGSAVLHPFDGVTDPIDPLDGRKQDKYSWAKSPRYDIPGKGLSPMEAGPLSRQVMAGRPGAEPWQDYDPLFLDCVQKLGNSVMVRVLARMHEAPKLYLRVKDWLSKVDLHDKFYIKPEELPEGKGFGSTEAARGALSDWIHIKDGRIENYQVVTPTAWNIGPRDSKGQNGPIEASFLGTHIRDQEDPLEIGVIARSFDSCLVCTVHCYDKKTNRELARFKVGPTMSRS
ncbi:MAG: nickel-dependent hydrogenase large subunit [Candidatus Melainabacteria bacterium]|nr:nickel-dependent hydrogenase large subunit [Candidatus Melainabacteria bacterium]